jgi:predicted protein tyrosine phosphatase
MPLEDLAYGKVPTNPEGELIKIRRAVDAVIESLDRQDGVLVHCDGGTGRSGTVVGAVLVDMGERPGEVAAWLDRVHLTRGRSGWPESPWQSTVLEWFTGSA